MTTWRANAVVWINDPQRGCVVVGSFGYAWWEDRHVCLGAFERWELTPVSAFYDEVSDHPPLRFLKEEAPLAAVLRFVRTGLPPMKGRFIAPPASPPG